MANQNNNNNANNANNNSNTNQNNNNNNANSHQQQQQHTLNLHHAGLANPSQLIISSSQLLSTMPSLAVAAAAAGITTTLLPLGSGIGGQDLNTVSVSNGTSNAAGVASAASASSSSSSASASSVGAGGGGGNSSNSNTALLDLITCKLVAPFHVVNDPRMLDCGSSACFSCIMSSKDSERNLKCPYCNKIHTIPMDTSKIVANKNLQNFLKINFRQLNQGFSKQLEDSMFALERKCFSFIFFFVAVLRRLLNEASFAKLSLNNNNLYHFRKLILKKNHSNKSLTKYLLDSKVFGILEYFC